MRIIHTSDWHLGKTLDLAKNSRLEEQEEFLRELCDIADNEAVDMIIIAGDIYDNGNPQAKAEKLFYKYIKILSQGGNRPILVIAGNHDNPERLIAAAPLAEEQGVMIIGTPKDQVPKGPYGICQVVDSGEGFIEIELKGERAVIVTLPYPSEKRLNEVFDTTHDDDKRRESYSEKIEDILRELSLKYREDTINLMISHLYVNGGEKSDSERSIELGGTLAVFPTALPEKAQYIALGHLHRPQRIGGAKTKVYYSGSPIQYSKSEIGYSKSIYEVELKPKMEPQIKSIYLKNYKPIEVWKCSSIEAALEKCKENSERNCWVYIEIETEEFISQEHIKELNSYKKDIVEIRPIIKGQDEELNEVEVLEEKSMGELFREYYKAQRGVDISEELESLFLSIVEEDEEGELDET